MLALTKKYGIASTDEACAIGLEAGACEYRFVRRYLERNPQLPLNLRQVDPLMRKLPHTAAEDLLEIIMRGYERFSTLLTFNRPVEDWGKPLGDVAAVSAMLDRLLHHGHVLKCGPRTWRTRTAQESFTATALPSRSLGFTASRQNARRGRLDAALHPGR